jgi:hypothetical protein
MNERKDLSMPPYYENPEPFRGRPPTALFIVRARDPFLVDSITMHSEKRMVGRHGIIKIHSSTSHRFTCLSPRMVQKQEMD